METPEDVLGDPAEGQGTATCEKGNMFRAIMQKGRTGREHARAGTRERERDTGFFIGHHIHRNYVGTQVKATVTNAQLKGTSNPI